MLSSAVMAEESLSVSLEPANKPLAAAPPGGGKGRRGVGGDDGSARLSLKVGVASDPNCMERKYLVAAWRSCSLSSAVCLLKNLRILKQSNRHKTVSSIIP